MSENEAGEIRVIVAARYPSARAGLRALLDGRPGIAVIGETASLEPSAEFSADAADVVVLESDHPGAELVDGIEAPVVGIGSGDVSRGPLARPGAWLGREADGATIAAAIVAVAHGLVVTDPALPAHRPGEHEEPSSDAGLTPREQAVLRLVAVGLPNKGIARELGISDHTVKFHVAGILGKLGAASRAEAVALAARQGLLPL